jgi:hypothetical protein
MLRPGARSALLGLAALAVLAASLAAAQSIPPLSFSSLVDQAVAAFPQLEGDVADVQGGTLTLVLSAPEAARPGLQLEVFREGREIRHPRTGQVLGRAEQVVGRAVITRVADRLSVATVLEPGAEPVKVGDRARTPAGKVKIVLVTLSGPGVKTNMAEAVGNEVYEGLTRSGRFAVVLGDQIAVWLAQRQVAPEAFVAGTGVRDAAERFKADNLLVVHLQQIERKPFMDVRLFTTARAEPLFSQSAFVPSSIRPAQPGRFSGTESAAAQPERKTRSLLARLLGWGDDPSLYSASDSPIQLREVARFPFTVTSMDVAIGPGDQIPRLVVTDSERVYLYRIVNRTLEPEWTFYARWLGRVISVQLAELTGDGVLDVVANRFDTRIGMSSLVLGSRNGKAEEVGDVHDGILIAVDEKGTGVRQTLWSQRFREESFFAKGLAQSVVVQNGRLATDRTVPVPDQFRATGATYANLLSKDSRALVFIDDQGRLRVHTGTEEIWRSSTVVGGGLPKIEVVRFLERGGRSYYYRMEPTPLAVDLDGDGLQEIVVPQNQSESGLLAVVFRGPAGLRFQLVNTGFGGIVVGLGALPGEDGGPPALIAGVTRYSGLLQRGGDTQIIIAAQE